MYGYFREKVHINHVWELKGLKEMLLNILFVWLLGRFGEEFVEKRRDKLQLWMNRICLHPVLSQSFVFKHFITCGENEKVIT